MADVNIAFGTELFTYVQKAHVGLRVLMTDGSVFGGRVEAEFGGDAGTLVLCAPSIMCLANAPSPVNSDIRFVVLRKKGIENMSISHDAFVWLDYLRHIELDSLPYAVVRRLLAAGHN